MIEEDILHSGSFIDRFDNAINVTFYKNTREHRPIPKPEDYVLTVDKSNLTFPYNTDFVEITVTCTPWTDEISVDAPYWLEVTPTYGGNNTITYTVNCSANDSVVSRNGVITISVEGGRNVKVNVYQDAKPDYTIFTIPDFIRADEGVGTYTLDTWCEGATPFLSDPQVDWWNYTYVGEVDGKRRYNITVESNSGQARSTGIKVRLDEVAGVSTMVLLTQEGAGPGPEPAGDITVTPATLTFDASKSSQTVMVRSQYPVTFDLPRENWISVSKDSVITEPDSTQYSIICETNMESTQRRATIKFYVENDSSKYVILTIIQDSL